MNRGPRRPTPRRTAGALPWIVTAGVFVAPAACTPQPEVVDTIAAETFVDTYVDLRMATLLAGVDQIPLAERDRILAEHGVGEQDLLDFVDLRGGDPDYMHAVWDSVEARIDRLRAEINAPAPEGYTPPDSTGS